ncbi:DUF11 domain-containing protein, partial [bacterium]|nr:DUF11 domain-containing protein [bacterium]
MFSRGGNLWTTTFPGADIAVHKAANAVTRNIGTPATYTIVVTNRGPDAATNVAITDQLPLGLTFGTAFATTGTYSEGTGVWAIGAMAVGQADTLIIDSVVDPSAAGSTIINTAAVTASDQVDGNPGNDESTVEIVVPSVDLVLSKTVDNPLPNEGATVSYLLLLTNGGPDAATGVQVLDLLPTGVTFVSATPSQGTYNPGTGVWDLGTVATAATLSITATVDAGTAGQTITNNAAVSAVDQGDINPGNNSGLANFTVQSADLELSKSVSDTSPVAGQFVTYEVVLRNNGPFTAIGITISDPLPAGVAFDSATASQGSYDEVTGTWNVGNMVNATVDTLTIVASVDTGTGGMTIVNTASVAGVTQADPVTANNAASAALTVATSPLTEVQLTVAGTDQRPAWCPGDNEIVFDSNRSGNRDLWAIPVGGGTA